MKAILFKEDLKPYLIEMPDKFKCRDECGGKDNGCCWGERCSQLQYVDDLIKVKENAIPFDESCIDEVTELAVSTIEVNKNPHIEIGVLPDTIYEVPGLDDMVEIEYYVKKKGDTDWYQLVSQSFYYSCVNSEEGKNNWENKKLAFLKKREESQAKIFTEEEVKIIAFNTWQYFSTQPNASVDDFNEWINDYIPLTKKNSQ